MTKRYTGGVISSSLPTVNAAGASGVFLLSQQADYQSRNSWPPFKVEESLRFRSSASAYLSRTPSVASNRKTWTWSGWVKRGTLGVSQYFFSGGTGGGDTTQFGMNFLATDKLNWLGGSGTQYRTTTQVFRDPAAWYHIVLAFDTTLATANNRIKIYVNGTQITAFDNLTNPTQNVDYGVNQAEAHNIGRWTGASGYFDGYMSEVYFVDGQALTPSSFGATDKDGNWSPIAYTGTYGQNGFYVNFRDNTSATTMGYDYSGNGNNWTLNGFNVSTANTSYDIMIDVPEDQDSANVRANYCTLNPVFNSQYTGSNLTGANLDINSPTSDGFVAGTFALSSGKWYYEATRTNSAAAGLILGIASVTASPTSELRNVGTGLAYSYLSTGIKSDGSGGAGTSYGATFTTNDVIGVAFDLDGGSITFYKNGVSQGVAYTGITGTFYPAIGDAAGASGGQTASVNFGQRPFAYTPPSGFKSLNTFNLPEPTIKQPNKHFDASLYTGTRATQTITNGGFQPDLIWFKPRSLAYSHHVLDTIRGTTRDLNTNGSSAEYGWTGNLNLTPNSSGFSIGADSTEQVLNEVGATYVAWQWNAGGANTTNTSGSITSIVRANPTAGFSIVTYTGNGSAGATVGHGLGATPAMIIVKNRSGVNFWIVQHQSLTGITYNLYLNGTDSQQNDGQFTAKSSTTVTLRSGGSVNTNSSNYVMYCFAPIDGYSAFGSYTGNGSADGTFVYTGFRPRFVLYKSATSASVGDWRIHDTSRSTFNAAQLEIYAQSAAAEPASSDAQADILSNGFKLRGVSGNTSWNESGVTYIYAAFAEMPFKYARAR